MKTLLLVLAFFPFAIITSITPGPNNFMLAASGANFGYRRTIPHVLGVIIGFLVLALMIGLGLGPLITSYPAVHVALKVLGAVFLVYLAWRIASAGARAAKGEKGRPLTFLEAALFQWVNVKAWLVIVNAIALYTTVGGNMALELSIILVGFFVASVIASNTWAAFGVGIHKLIGSSPEAMRIFNIAMGILLLATLVPLLV
jgi:threonine/homoserine/homoserine lactone efflux protein